MLISWIIAILFVLVLGETYIFLQSLTITSCGNFGLVGYSSGHVDVFNLQSGLYRGSYGKETDKIIKLS